MTLAIDSAFAEREVDDRLVLENWYFETVSNEVLFLSGTQTDKICRLVKSTKDIFLVKKQQGLEE